MKFKARIIKIITISIMLNMCLTGCWNSREVNSLAFMTSIGLDKTEDGIMLTIQVLNPRTIASQKTVNEPTVIVYTEEGKDTIEMIRKMITKSSRKLNGTHLKTVVFGEDFAKAGITEVLDLIMREHQFRTDLYFVVAKDVTAHEVLNTLTDMDPIPSVKLYNSLHASDEIWAGTKTVKTISLVNSIVSDGENPVLTGVEIGESHEEYDSLAKLEKMESDPLKINGLAVFDDDKFVGWLNEDESKGYNYIMGDVPSTMAHVEDESVGKITFEVTKTRTKRTASLVDGKLVITVDINITANIETASDKLDITKEENIQELEKLSEQKLDKVCNETLQRVQELGSDIFGFGEVVHRTYPELWGTLKDNWNSTFKDLPVEIHGKVKIEKTGTISNSFFMKEK